jgi:hypothetical protein
MSKIRLVVPITPLRGWGHGKMAHGERILAASPIVSFHRSGGTAGRLPDAD